MDRAAKVQALIERYFPPPDSHPYRALERELNVLLTPFTTVLEIGCGRTAPVLRTLKGHAKTLIGIDVTEFTITDDNIVLLSNDVTDMKDVATESVDVAFSRSVMEHIRNVEAAFAEISRVLKSDGRYVFLTPNLLDYASLIASVIPSAMHPWIVKRTEGRDEADTFPTFYRCNTQRRIEKLAAQNGFAIEEFGYLGQYPNYFKFSPFLFWVGCIYAKFLEGHRSLHKLQGWILCTLRKSNLDTLAIAPRDPVKF